jgi:hypothetical protein
LIDTRVVGTRERIEADDVFSIARIEQKHIVCAMSRNKFSN